jgi:hypothetical protein
VLLDACRRRQSVGAESLGGLDRFMARCRVRRRRLDLDEAAGIIDHLVKA